MKQQLTGEMISWSVWSEIEIPKLCECHETWANSVSKISPSSHLAIIWSHRRWSIALPIPIPQRIQVQHTLTHTQTHAYIHTQTQLEFLPPHLEKRAETSVLVTCLPRTYSPLHFIFGTWNKIKMNLLGKTVGKYCLALLVRNWNPTRLLDNIQLFFGQQHIVNSALKTKAKYWRETEDQERNRHTGGSLVIPHKWSRVFFKAASLGQAPCRAGFKQFLLNALRVKARCKFKEERISETEYATS